MSTECTSGSCTVGEREANAANCESESCCPACRSSCGGDPVACAEAMWNAAFFQAMKQAQVEILKAKMQKAWGAKMDKAADIILEAMGLKWQSLLAEAKANASVQDQLRRLWQEGK